MNEERKIEISKICENLKLDDKRKRKNALEQIKNILLSFNFDHQDELNEMFDSVHMYISKCISDSSENCRELAIDIFKEFILKLNVNDYYLAYIVPNIEKRLAPLCIVEDSEEIRLQLVDLLHEIIKKYNSDNRLLPFFDMLKNILTKTVSDSYPALKKSSCSCIKDLTLALPKHFHMHSEQFLNSVLPLMKHQHFKVRLDSIKCLANIIEFGDGKINDDILINLACSLAFDSNINVKQATLVVCQVLLLKLRDRYSYFHRVIPVIFLGLTDEIETVKKEAEIVWCQAGDQYFQENEKDYKDQIDFLNEKVQLLPDFIGNCPSFGCCQLVNRHTSKIISALTNELVDWREEIRQMASRILLALVCHAKDDITQHLQNLFPLLYKSIKDNDELVRKNVKQSSKIIGHFISPNVYLTIVLPQIYSESFIKFSKGQLDVLASLLDGTPNDKLQLNYSAITKKLENDLCQTRELSLELLDCCDSLISKCRFDEENVFILFKILITICSISCVDELKLRSELLLNKLAQSFELLNKDELYKKFSKHLLENMLPNVNSWTAFTTDKLIFETLLVKSTSTIENHFEIILDILKIALNPETIDNVTRLKILLILSKGLVQLSNTIDNHQKFYSINTNKIDQLITEIITPNLMWHAGITNESIRSAGVACLCAALPLCAEPVDLNHLLPHLLSLLNENPLKTRLYVLRAFNYVFKQNSREMTNEQINEIYPGILKRLDDGNDEIRLVAAETLLILWKTIKNREQYDANGINSQHYDYICTTLMIHLDDDDKNFTSIIYDNLFELGQFNKTKLMNKVNLNKEKFRNHELIDELIKSLEML